MNNLINPAIFGDQGNLFITFIASFLIWLMFASIFALWLFHEKFDTKTVASITFVSFLAWFVSNVFKDSLHTMRPFFQTNFPPLTLTIPTNNAFPSTHTAIAFSLSSGVMRKDIKIGLVYFLLALLVGVGRVASHVHYVIDIAGGALIGIATFYVADRLIHIVRLQK